MTVKVDMHVGDYGTIFEMTILNRTTNKALPLGGVITKVFLFQPPDEEESFIREATISTPPLGNDGKLKYVFEEGDIYIAGEWKVQALVQGNDGLWHTDIEIFSVGENIATPSS